LFRPDAEGPGNFLEGLLSQRDFTALGPADLRLKQAGLPRQLGLR
jgi:hypothetical protein